MALAVEQWAALPSDDPRRPLFARALRVLAAREHGREELRDKLLVPPAPWPKRGEEGRRQRADIVQGIEPEKPDEDMLDDVLDALEREGYLSDERFAESFVNMRARRGHGPLRIKNDMKQKKLPTDKISNAFEACETDWFELARDVRERKFGEELPTEFKEKARQMRFLQSRGFEMQHIQYALQED
jgi:regulatory protein